MEKLLFQSEKVIRKTSDKFIRHLYDEIDWSSKCIAITGSRGTGKTTMLLQYLKAEVPADKRAYIKADDIFFSENRLYAFAEWFLGYGGHTLVIDEVHKYPEWSREIKMMYDFLPELQIIFTGSSILEIFKGFADLSRRVLQYNLTGMSFREYIAITSGKIYPTYSLDEVLQHKVTIDELPLPLFKEYLQKGYYPYFKETGYFQRLKNTINQTLEVDIPSFVGMNMSTSRKLMQLLYIISKSVPFKPNYTKLAEMTGIHRNLLKDYIVYLERAGLILQLREATKGVRLLGKTEKLYLENNDLIQALAESEPNVGNVRETFFFNQLKRRYPVLSSKVADFSCNYFTFEVGGKSKDKSQIEGVDKAYLVKDELEYGIGNIIPLWQFGFLY